jgi:hypothetical protein
MPYDFASDLLGTGPQLRATPEGTPRRPVETTPKRGEGASFGTRIKAGFVDDLPTEIRILARARFPDLPEEQAVRRYGIKDGRPYYIDEQNQARWETDGLWQRAKNYVAEILANLPAEIGAAAGAASPVPGGMMAGAAAGEKARQLVGEYVFDEPQTLAWNVLKMATAGAGAKVGQVAGRVLPRRVEAVATRITTPPAQQSAVGKAARVVKAAGRDFIPDAAEETRVRALMQKHGVSDPTLVETTGSRRLADRFSLLGDLPATADAVQDVKTTRMGQVSNAVQELLDALSPIADREEAGKLAAEASRGAVKTATGARTEAVAPLYKQAMAESGRVDSRPAVSLLEELLEGLPEEGGSVRPVLERARSMLFRTEHQPHGAAKSLLDAQGNPIHPQGGPTTVPEYDLERLDSVKKEMDALIDGSHPKAKDIVPSIKGDLERRLVALRDALVAEADKASPGYKTARDTFADLSPEVDALKQGAVGTVASLEGDKVTQATTRLLESAFTSPQTVRRARDAIRAQDPKAWDAVVRQYIQRLWDQVPEAAADQTVNYGGRLAGKMGQKGRDRVLEAALEHDPAMLQRVKDFQEVLSRTGLLFRRESQTATRQVALKEMDREANKGALGRVSSALQVDISAPGRQIGEWLQTTITTPRYQQRLLDALQDPKTAKALGQLKRMPPRTLALVQGVATFLGTVTGASVPGRIDRATTPDRRPEAQEDQERRP